MAWVVAELATKSKARWLDLRRKEFMCPKSREMVKARPDRENTTQGLKEHKRQWRKTRSRAWVVVLDDEYKR